MQKWSLHGQQFKLKFLIFKPTDDKGLAFFLMLRTSHRRAQISCIKHYWLEIWDFFLLNLKILLIPEKDCLLWKNNFWYFHTPPTACEAVIWSPHFTSLSHPSAARSLQELEKWVRLCSTDSSAKSAKNETYSYLVIFSWFPKCKFMLVNWLRLSKDFIRANTWIR